GRDRTLALVAVDAADPQHTARAGAIRRGAQRPALHALPDDPPRRQRPRAAVRVAREPGLVVAGRGRDRAIDLRLRRRRLRLQRRGRRGGGGQRGGGAGEGRSHGASTIAGAAAIRERERNTESRRLRRLDSDPVAAWIVGVDDELLQPRDPRRALDLW